MSSNSSTGNNSDFLSEHEVKVVVGIQLASAALSCLSSLLIVLVMVWLKQVRSMTSRIIFTLSVSCCLYGVSYLLGAKHINDPNIVDDAFCEFQGIFNNFMSLAVFFWTSVIAWNLFSVVYLTKLRTAWEVWYHVGVWSISLLLSLLPLSTNSYGDKGDDNYWCWLDYTTSGKIWRIVSFYLPLYLCILFCLAMYFLIWWKLRKLKQKLAEDDGFRTSISNINTRLLLYPLVFLLLWIFPTINRIWFWANETEVFALFVLHVLTDPLLGFAFSLIYGLDKSVQRKLTIKLLDRGVCTTCLKRPEESYSESEEEWAENQPDNQPAQKSLESNHDRRHDKMSSDSTIVALDGSDGEERTPGPNQRKLGDALPRSFIDVDLTN